MSDLQALYRAVVSVPSDKSARLVYADELDENYASPHASLVKRHKQWMDDGNPGPEPSPSERADFIRTQIARSHMSPDDPAYAKLVAREEALLNANDNKLAWAAAESGGCIPRHLSLSSVKFNCGFIEKINTSGKIWLQNGEHLSQLIPIQDVSLTQVYNLKDIAHSPALGKLKRLSLNGNFQNSTDSLRALANSPHIENLTRLDISGSMNDNDAAIILNSPRLKNLKTLSLSGNRLRDMTRLLQSPLIAQLDGLYLSSAGLDAEDARTIANSPRLSKLKTLVLAGNQIGNEGAIALANSPHLTELQQLNLSLNHIGDEGVEALARRKQPLAELYLEHNMETGRGVLAFTGESATPPATTNVGKVHFSHGLHRMSNAEKERLAPALDAGKVVMQIYG